MHRYTRYRMPIVLIIGLFLTILSSTAFVVTSLWNELPMGNDLSQQQQQRSTSTAKATTKSIITMNRNRNMDGIVATNDDDLVDYDDTEKEEELCATKTTISMAFCGNSMLYFNDSPRLLELIITIVRGGPNHNIRVVQDSCLRGGATLSSLFEHGNGMTNKFKTQPATIQLHDLLSTTAILPNYILHPTCHDANSDNDNRNNDGNDDNNDDDAVTIKKLKMDTSSRTGSRTQKYDIGSHSVQQLLSQSRNNEQQQHPPPWDYIILNDYTQGPARLQSRQETQHILRTKYVPLLLESAKQNSNRQQPTMIVIQTPAYQKENIKGSYDLGDFIHFSNLLAEGVQAYVQTIQDAGIEKVHVAPVGEAYRYIYNTNQTLWNKLYSWDHFHPSPYGTYLQICVLYCVMFDECLGQPGDDDNDHLYYNDNYWLYSRYMQPTDEEPLPRPTMEEAKELRRVAGIVTGVYIEKIPNNSGATINKNNNNNNDDDNEKDDNENDDEVDRSSG